MLRSILIVSAFVIAVLLGLDGALLAQTPAPAPSPAPVDSFAGSRDSLMQVVLKSIAGREDAPAESVFKNIKMLRGVPAGRLVRIMNLGYGRSLGVSCTYCHVADKWESEEKEKKQVARDMSALVGKLNGELLPAIAHLDSPKPIVNCTTCHRGQRKPALNL